MEAGLQASGDDDEDDEDDDDDDDDDDSDGEAVQGESEHKDPSKEAAASLAPAVDTEAVRECLVCTGPCTCAGGTGGDKPVAALDGASSDDDLVDGIENIGASNHSRRAFRDAPRPRPLDQADIQERVRRAVRAKQSRPRRGKDSNGKGRKGGRDEARGW